MMAREKRPVYKDRPRRGATQLTAEEYEVFHRERSLISSEKYNRTDKGKASMARALTKQAKRRQRVQRQMAKDWSARPYSPEALGKDLGQRTYVGV